MKKRYISIVLVLALLTVVFTGCSKNTTSTSNGGKSFKIGYSCNNFNDTFQTYIVDAAKAYVNDNPELSIDVQDAQEDVIKQQDQINAFIEQGVDALVVVPVDTSAMDPITEAAKKENIPLVYVNRNPFGEDTVPENVYYVGSQEIIAGQLQMEFVGEELGGKGNVAILVGILSNEGAVKRTEGNESIIEEKYPDIKVLAKESGNWQRDQGLTITENWLTAYGNDLNAILSNNDEMALGALKASRDAGRDDIIIVGVDAIPDALASIEEGGLTATVLQDAVGQGKGALEAAHKALKGESQDSINWVPFKLITTDNLDEYK
ncbi:sugar ABC transporter substrate-binding protein [Paratissierella segnis]|jgi:inositol transport system substrate-binding protein|uniref:Sugar ABC transporter substrate-binding protein n=1 Tax=Paratissierella segnis TaxID=2763679 RepID=A0A926IEC3_9FIRM|nr:sugar ABC transporter substrate-binding protein [Paratissierella segnis]MBC8587217.1 sugar ABC transporter substrate-binding protein [Paratissierella segnis]